MEKLYKYNIKKIICFTCVVFIMFIVNANNIFAETKGVDGYKLFVGGMGDGGIANSWPVYFNIIGNYSNNGSSYTLDSVSISAFIDPKKQYNGNINGSVIETIDYGATTTRRLSSSVWEHQPGIFPDSAAIYFTRVCYPNKTFRTLAEEVGDYKFACGEYLIYGNGYQLTLSISGPK